MLLFRELHREAKIFDVNFTDARGSFGRDMKGSDNGNKLMYLELARSLLEFRLC